MNKETFKQYMSIIRTYENKLNNFKIWLTLGKKQLLSKDECGMFLSDVLGMNKKRLPKYVFEVGEAGCMTDDDLYRVALALNPKYRGCNGAKFERI